MEIGLGLGGEEVLRGSGLRDLSESKERSRDWAGEMTQQAGVLPNLRT